MGWNCSCDTVPCNQTFSLDLFKNSADRRDDSYLTIENWEGCNSIRILFTQAIHDYVANEVDELSFKVGWRKVVLHNFHHFFSQSFAKAGDIVYVLDMSDTDWWKARIKGKEGQVKKFHLRRNPDCRDSGCGSFCFSDLIAKSMHQVILGPDEKNMFTFTF